LSDINVEAQMKALIRAVGGMRVRHWPYKNPYGERSKIMDTWIGARAVAYDIPVYAQDEDFAKIPTIGFTEWDRCSRPARGSQTRARVR
jgi:predicted nucleic acid-binding protein